MDFHLWHTMLKDAVYWQDINERLAVDIYRRTVVAWGLGQQYYTHNGLNRVNLTELYEQCKMLSILKEGVNEKETPWGG
jgi:hypothetical protein